MKWSNGLELEVGPDGQLTGRWRRAQFYASRAPDGRWLRDLPSERRPCEWREPPAPKK